MSLRSIRTKAAQIQFWGTSKNPTWTGISLDAACCPCDCFVFHDDFIVFTPTTIVRDWNEVVGDWGLTGDFLVENMSPPPTATLNAVAIGQLPVPSDSGGEMTVRTWVVDPLTDDIYYLYAGATSDTSKAGAVEAKFTYLGSQTWKTECCGETVLQLGTDFTIGGYHKYNLWLCTDAETGMVKAGVTSVGDPPIWSETGANSSGRYYGLGHNVVTGQTAQYDLYTATELRRDGKNCNDCFCWCLDYAPGKTLRATVTGTTGWGVSCLGGGFDIPWVWSGVGAEGWWVGQKTVIGPNGRSVDFGVKVICAAGDDDLPDQPGKNFTLQFLYPNCCTPGDSRCTSGFKPLSTSTCRPFHLIFGPFERRSDDLDCLACEDPLAMPPVQVGQFYIEVTE